MQTTNLQSLRELRIQEKAIKAQIDQISDLATQEAVAFLAEQEVDAGFAVQPIIARAGVKHIHHGTGFFFMGKGKADLILTAICPVFAAALLIFSTLFSIKLCNKYNLCVV